MPVIYDDNAQPSSMTDMQRSVGDGFVSVQATLDQEHDPDGRHTDITVSSIGPRTSDPIEVSGGIRILGGPWVYEDDGSSAPIGGGAVLRPTTLTASQNNYSPVGINQAVILEIEGSADYDITGIDRGEPGRRRDLRIVNRGNNVFTLVHNSSSSLAKNRIAVAGNGDYDLVSGGIVDLYYDLGSEIWRVGNGPSVTQVRSVQSKAVTHTTGGSNDQDFTLDVTLADYTLAVVTRLSEQTQTRAKFTSDNYTATLTSNTNLRITRDVDSGDVSLFYSIVEYQNLSA